MATIYVSDGIRDNGDEVLVQFSNEGRERCSRCGGDIPQGEKYSVRPLVKAKPVCHDCEPFSEQIALLDGLDPPKKRFGSQPPTHKTAVSYIGEDGRQRKKSECPDPRCRGKGYWMVKKEGYSNSKKEECDTCNGTGVIWTLEDEDI